MGRDNPPGPYTGWVGIAGDQFVLADEPSRVVKLKGSNFRTVNTHRGIFEHWDEMDVDRTLDAASAMGCNCLRTYAVLGDPEACGRWDGFKEKAAVLGMRMYASFAWPNAYAPADSEEYAADCKHLIEFIRRYADDPGIIAYDIINEPEWFSHQAWQWRFEEQGGKKRLDWLLRVADTIHEHDDRHPVTIGFIFNYSWWTPDWARVLIDRLDYVDFHYYHRTYQARGLDVAIREMKAQTSKPIVVGEFGQSSDPTYSTGHEEVHSEETQRQLYVHAMKAVQDEDVVGCLQWCTCSHCDKPEAGENEYGVHRQDYSPKPAAAVYRDAVKVPLFA